MKRTKRKYGDGGKTPAKERDLTKFNEDIKKEFDIKMAPTTWHRDYYDLATDSMFHSRPLLDANDTTDFFINEVPHAMQRRDLGKVGMQYRNIEDYFNYGHRDSTYNKPGTIEYEAHKGAYRDSVMKRLNKYENGGLIDNNMRRKKRKSYPQSDAQAEYNYNSAGSNTHDGPWMHRNGLLFGYGGLIDSNPLPSIGLQAFNSQLGVDDMEVPEKKQKHPGFMRRGGRIRKYNDGGVTAEQNFGGKKKSAFDQNVNYTSTIPAAAYGISQGAANNQINYVPPTGGPSASQSIVGSTGAWGSAISSASQLGTGLFGGQDKSQTSNAIATGVFDPAQNLNVWTDPNFSTGEKIFAQISPFYYGYEKNARDKKMKERAVSQQRAAMGPQIISNSVNSNYNNAYSQGYAEGGVTSTSSINIEGNELMVNPKGTIVRDFKHYPAHPEHGMNPMGDVVVPQGNTIIPKNRRKYFQDSSRDSRKTIMEGLRIMQESRQAKEQRFGGPEDRSLSYVGYDPGTFLSNYISGSAYTGQQGTQGSLNQIPFTTTNHDPYNLPGPRMDNGRYYSQDPAYALNTPGKYYGPVGPRMEGGRFATKGNNRRGINPDWRGYANTAMEYLAPAYNIGMGLFGKVDKLRGDDYTTRPIKGTHVTDEESLREINTGYHTALNSLKNSGKYSRGTQVALATQRMKAAAGSRERVSNINAEIDNRIASENAGIDARNKHMRFNVDDWNARSKAAKRNQLDQGIGQVSDLSVQDRYGREQREAIEYYYPNAYRRRKRREGKV